MQRSSVPGEKRIQGNPLEFHLRMFATALRDAGYRDRGHVFEVGVARGFGALAQANRASSHKPS